MSTRPAFTLIELLVVIAVIATLASMILMGASALWGDAKKKKTDAIIAAIHQGLELHGANKGGTVSPAEHPLASSKQASEMAGTLGLTWIRQGGTGVAPAILNIHRQVRIPTTRDAAIAQGIGPEEAELGSQGWGPKLWPMFDDDIFAGVNTPSQPPCSPLLLGVRRQHLGILGADQTFRTRFLRVSLPVRTPPNFPPNIDNSPLLVPQAGVNGIPADNKRLLDYVFGSSNAMSELAKLKAVWDSSADAVFNQPWPTVNPLVLSDKPAGSPCEDEWKHGRFRDFSSGNTWRSYRLPGLALYDAWNQELLYSISSTGRAILASAGKDGSFVISPGDDREYSPDLHLTGGSTGLDHRLPFGPQAKANDRDGTRDNVLNTGLQEW